MKTVILVGLFVIQCTPELVAQNQITFRQLSVRQGLSQNSVVAVAQDSTGFLWLATQDGLNRYDGRQFTVFPYTFTDITRPDYSYLGKVYVDRQDQLWIIPSDGKLYRLDVSTANFEPVPGIENATVIYQDRSHRYWVGTREQGLYAMDSGDGTMGLSEPSQVFSARELPGTTYNLGEGANGRLLMARDQHLAEMNLTTRQLTVTAATTLYGDTLRANFSDVVLDSEQREWWGTFGDGLYFRRGPSALRRVSELSLNGDLPDDLNVTDLLIDRRGRVWVATYGDGLFMIDFEEKQIRHFEAEKNNPRALHYQDVLCIYEDYTGTLWFGTDGAGASYYDEYLEKFNSLTNDQTPEDINIDVVRALTVDQGGALWIGTSGKGLTRYESRTNSWKTFLTTNCPLPSDRIMSLFVDEDNDLWIGTQGGGLAIREAVSDEFRSFHPSSDLPLAAQTVWCIYQDRAHRIWLGTRAQGLIRFDKRQGQLQQYKHNPSVPGSLPSNNVRTVAEDERGNLWIGTDTEGLAYLETASQQFTMYQQDTSRNALSSNQIKSLYFAPNGMLWIGTNGGGLNALDTERNHFYQYTTEDGLANNVIYAILPDEAGNLWLSSNRGITRFTPNDSAANQPAIINYTNYDGLATEFNTGAYYQDSAGTLYFGGLDGFYWFDPQSIRPNVLLPNVAITGFNVLGKPQSLLSAAQLTHNQNTVTFTFSSMQFALPEKNQYQYQLVDYDNEWVEAGNNVFARYTQLPPGNYTFQVKSSNYDGVWNPKPARYRFTIRPPWYATRLAKVM